MDDVTSQQRVRPPEKAGRQDSPIPRQPPWIRVKAPTSPIYRETRGLMRELGLTTVCEEAGCPNIYECWGKDTATFMINGNRCTRACGFCLVDTRHPAPLDEEEPQRVAQAITAMCLDHVVITAVARDDLIDGGVSGFINTIKAIRVDSPSTTIETLIPDFGGKREVLQSLVNERPDVINHNLETVARLQRAVRPSAGYARSLTLLARVKGQGVATKSGLITAVSYTHLKLTTKA